ncbi:MAG: hypothetical protein ACYSYV_08965 [Planctomycetota bacterium]|jgi:hypothetical protein
MNEQKNEEWLDELISRTINTAKPHFDPEKWKQKYPEEFQMLVRRAGQDSLPAAARQPDILKVILRSPFARLAAAAVIILAVSFFVAHLGPGEQERPGGTEAAKSPAEIMTMISLTATYRWDGMDGLEKKFEKAAKILGPLESRISMQELFEDLNG